MTRAKICGLTREADLAAAARAGADAVGVITGVPVDTPREVSATLAAELFDAVPPFVTGVVVTMPETVDEAVERVRATGASAVQVYPTLDSAGVTALRDRVDVDVFASVGVDDDVEGYARAADAVVLDTTDDADAGGTGRTHDWTRSRKLVRSLDTPVVLAGGLTPENVREAVETVGPAAVDTASGVERRGGVKDHDAVRAFVERARQATRTEREA
ncbi:MAG: phosphoribosylanthranilate isomerase [Salinirussus sp.]